MSGGRKSQGERGNPTKLYGNITGLKANQVRRLENLYKRRVPPNVVVSPELARAMTELSLETGRQVCILIDRRGNIEFVIVGDAQMVVIPDLSRHRAGGTRLRGLRSVHTHLKGEGLTRDDLVDLALLRFDLIGAVEVKDHGLPGDIFIAHLIPENSTGEVWEKLPPESIHNLNLDFTELIASLENEFIRSFRAKEVKAGEGAILVMCHDGRNDDPDDCMAELIELCKSSGLSVLDTIIQKRNAPDPKWVLGKGRLSDLVIRAMQLGADLVVFDGELKPAQIRTITDYTELKVIDRTQVILDIFAKRAKSRQGKIQVELAQLNYMLPRLIEKNTAMSRLTGGIGGRGPGETKLEINRRRARDRINRLEKELEGIGRDRGQQRSKRVKKELPVISIIGYTNAGKSTLLNTLTKSNVDARNMLFATLDPSSRRLRFPRDIEVIITDTVGFIRELPKELLAAFSATLDELKVADLLLHVVDSSDSHYIARIEAVDAILTELGLDDIPKLVVFNKMDLVDPDTLLSRTRGYNAVTASAVDSSTLLPLIGRMEGEMVRIMKGGRRTNMDVSHEAH
ncbi:MAG: GTPase HflX [Deltaproteobacteria bacterium]|uniref:GTPase HflX n=1 Tax=Candidatus Zymogenus saltonus TaxID=2844893 RepID=A0A9D8KFD8_9DELT|nr:GTPase HflX [Candidatus Zymogenus saltonus]